MDLKSLLSYVDELQSERFGMIFMNLKYLTVQKKKEMSEDFYHFNEKYYANACTFRISDNKMVMVYIKSQNPDEEIIFGRLMEDFVKLYDIYQLPYKVVKIDSDSNIKLAESYLELENQIENDMQWNTVHVCDEYDLKKHMRNIY